MRDTNKELSSLSGLIQRLSKEQTQLYQILEGLRKIIPNLHKEVTIDEISKLKGVLSSDILPEASGDELGLVTYRTGSWTPTLAFGGASVGLTYGAQVGSYIKINGLVFISLSITLTAKGASVGAAVISGIPYPVLTATWGGAMVASYAAMAAMNGLMAFAVAGTSTILPFTFGAAASAQLTDVNFTNTSIIGCSGCYRTSE